jgi:hypothetical protein
MLIAAAVLVTAPAALGASRNAPPYMTADPSKNLTVVVVITDGGISASAFRQYVAGDSSSMETVKGPLPSGGLATFNIFNRGKKAHDFSIFGKKTPKLAPGRTAHLYFKLGAAGKFPYRSTLDASKTFRGFLTVG